ncbi:MAG TPA: cytochrome c family protein [Planctomycetota bacterium]|nr:cytochrome c family protein [Planctomycetota bacterium]
MNTHRITRARAWLLLAAPLGLAGLLGGATKELSPPLPAPAPAAAKYIGAAKCKNCHSAEKVGAQYGHWERMGHAKAYETLAGDKAKELAKAKGIDDPQKADACLKCHVTAFGEPADNLAKGFKPELGVQCESCHGPGEAHLKARMAAAAETDPAKAAPVAASEIIAVPPPDTCLKCHNPESPSYKPFCFKEASAKISHPNPARTRTPEELEKLNDPYGCGKAGSCQCPKPAGAAAK